MRRLVETPVGAIHVRCWGAETAPDDPVVVLLHQTPSSSRMWCPVAERLASDSRVVAPDLLGYGDSDAPSVALTLPEHAALLREALREVADPPYVLVGHHTGAVFAAHLAGEHGEETAVLGLLGYPLYPDHVAKYARLAGLMKPTEVAPDGGGLEDAWYAATASMEPDTSARTRLEAYTDRLRAGTVWFTGYIQLLATDLRTTLSRARADHRATQVIAAEQDPVSRYAEEVAQSLGVELTSIEGGAWVTVEHPDRVATALRSLVSEAREERR